MVSESCFFTQRQRTYSNPFSRHRGQPLGSGWHSTRLACPRVRVNVVSTSSEVVRSRSSVPRLLRLTLHRSHAGGFLRFVVPFALLMRVFQGLVGREKELTKERVFGMYFGREKFAGLGRTIEI